MVSLKVVHWVHQWGYEMVEKMGWRLVVKKVEKKEVEMVER
jgi:hypothetical protein